jgi:release factor glutamine methyltransferase
VISRQEAGPKTLKARNWDQAAQRKAQDPPLNVGQALEEASSHLRALSDTPRVEAEILLMHVIGCSRAGLLAHPERPLLTPEVERYEGLVGDRARGCPLPYLTGRAEFYGLEIVVTPDVMIPRPETEMLVDLALERRPSTVIDVGTGSGCIAVALAAHLPGAGILGIDISPAALAVARRNVERHGLDKRVQLMVGDLLDRRPGPVDLIVSNPPYVSADEWASLPPSILYHEPHLALNGGTDGLEVIRRLLYQSQGLLKRRGALLIEIGASQGEAAREIAETCFPWSGISIRVHPDLAGRDRVLEVQV